MVVAQYLVEESDPLQREVQQWPLYEQENFFIKNDISGEINSRGIRIHASIAFMVGAIARENTLFTPEF